MEESISRVKGLRRAFVECGVIPGRGRGFAGKSHSEKEGVTPAYFVHPTDALMEHAILCDDAYFTLLPDESREIDMAVRRS